MRRSIVWTLWMVLGAALVARAQESEPAEPRPDEPRPEGVQELLREMEALRREVEELRRWKEGVEAEQAARRGEILPPARISEAVDRTTAVADLPDPDDKEPRIRLPNSLSLGVSGQVRVRTEYDRHLYSPADPDGDRRFDFTHMRTRVRFDASVEDWIDAVVELQDVRTFGEEGSTTADTEGVDLKRGFLRLEEIAGEPVSVDLGRFVLAYGDQRLIGDLEWVDQGRSYDGVRVSYASGDHYADLFGTRIRDDAFGLADEQDLLGVYGGVHDVVDGLGVEGYALLFRDQADLAGETGVGDTRFLTLGSRLAGATGAFDYTGEVALQTGEVRDDDLSAWAFAVVGGYTFRDTSWQPRLLLEVDYASGNDSPGDGDNETFQTLFPTNHKHYGYADLLGWSNLFDIRSGVSVKPAKRLAISFDWHHFRLADPDGGWINAAGQTIRPGASGASRDLGDELDLLVRYGVTDTFSLLAGWSHFFAGEFVDDTGRDRDADFLYLQALLKF